MRGFYRRLVTTLIHPYTVVAMFVLVMIGLYAFEKIIANMPFVAMVIATISAFAFILTRKAVLSAYIGMATVSVITIASAIKYRLKGFDLHVYDFAFTGSDGSAMTFLMEKYASLIVPVLILMVFAIAFLVVIAFAETRSRLAWSRRVPLLLAACGGLYLSYPLSADEPRYFHYLGGFNASSFFVSTLDLEYLFRQSELSEKLGSVPAQPSFVPGTNCGDTRNQPDIFVVLSESNTIPTVFPQLKTDSEFAKDFRSDDGKRRPLMVETFGGGTWVSNLSVMSGLSSADFGVTAPYLTMILEGKVRGALPEVLAACGYRTVEITPVNHTFVNEGPFMQSIGFQTILDYDSIGATQYAHQDAFYFKAAENFIRQHHAAGGGPLLLSLKTMFPHSPYNEPLVSENHLPEYKFGGDKETDEYLNRVLASQNDFKGYLATIKSLTTERGAVVLEYGDHQSFVTKNLDDQTYGGNSLVDLRSVAYQTYYTVHSFGYDLDMSAFRDGDLDIGFLGAALVKAARLPLSPMYRELIALSDHCAGRFHDCADRAAVDRHLRKRADSGMLDVLETATP